jgi:type I restriction enzyme S subunit
MSKVKQYSNYADFGQQWLGDLPSHWQVMRTKLLFDLITEPAPIGNSEELLSVYTALGVKPRKELEARGNKASSTDNYWRVKQGDIIVNKLLAWMGAIGISEYNGVTSPAYDILRPKENVNPYFYNFLFRNPIASREFKRHSRGIMDMRLRLYFTRFGDIKLPLPPIEEQDKIVEYLNFKLSKIDRFIRKKKQLIKLLNEQKTGIINHAVTKGLDPNAKMKPSGIEWFGEIPDHWEVRKLKYVINGKLKYGANEPGGDMQENDPRYIRITDFDKSGNLREDTFCSLKSDLAEPYLLQDGDILFARSGGTVGKTFQFKNYKGKACYAGYLIKAEPNHSIVSSDFLFQFTNSGVYDNWKNFIFNKATIENIGADKYCNLPVIIPSLNEQIEIVEFIESESLKINKTISTIKKEIDLTQEYKTVLIADAITGKIDVRSFVIPKVSIEEEMVYEDIEEELDMVAEEGEEIEID